MSDDTIAAIARDLARALMLRARTRTSDDQQTVLRLQTELCAAVVDEAEQEPVQN